MIHVFAIRPEFSEDPNLPPLFGSHKRSIDGATVRSCPKSRACPNRTRQSASPNAPHVYTTRSLFPSLIPRETKLLLLHLSQLAQLFQYSRTLALINIQIMDQFSIPMYLINFNYGWPTPFPASNSQYRPSGPEDLGTSMKSPTHNPAGNYYVQSTGFEQLHLPVLS